MFCRPPQTEASVVWPWNGGWPWWGGWFNLFTMICTSRNFWNWLHKVDQVTLAGWTCLQWSALVGTFGTGYTKWIRWHWQYELLEMVTLSRSGDTGSMNFCNWLHTLSGSADTASMNFWNWLQKRLAAWTFAMLIKWTVFLNKSRSERGTTLMMDSRFAPWDVWQRCPHVMSI